MKLFAIYSFFSAVLCSLCTSAYSQSLGDIHWIDYPTRFYTQGEVLRLWIQAHYDVYGEDVSRQPWAQTFSGFWNHAVLEGAVPPYGWGVAPEKLGTTSSQPIPSRADGVEFLGAWPIFLFLPNRHLIHPDWLTLGFYLSNLNQLDSIFVPLLRAFQDSSSDSVYTTEFYPWWRVGLLVSNAVTATQFQALNLPYTRLFFLAPYYPSWWSMGGIRYPMVYDEGRDSVLLGESLGDNAPFADYDGYVLYSHNPNGVRLKQEYRWSSPRK